MKNDFENEVWEAFLKDAVIKHSLKRLEEYETDRIHQTPLPSQYIFSMKKFMHHYRQRTHMKVIMRTSKKIVSVFLLLMGICFSILLQSNEVRAACHDVLIKIYERYVEFFYTPSKISESSIPELGPIPDDYIKEQYSRVEG